MPIQRVTEDRDGENKWPPEAYTGTWEIYWRRSFGLRGGIKFRGEYENGQGHGEHVCFWQNGEIAQKGLMKRGKCDGVWTDFDQDGIKTLEGSYGPKGKVGIWRSYWSNGQIMKEEYWVSGIREGFYREFRTDGSLHLEGEYRSGQPLSGICRVMTWEGPSYSYLARFINGEEIERIEDENNIP